MTFSRKGKLARHKIIHKGDKQFACDFCKKTFSQSSILEQHRIIHTGLLPYKCDLCKKTFTQFHACEKSFPCGLCEMSFSDNSILAKHMMIHTDTGEERETSAHLNRKKSIKKDSSNQSTFVVCGESIKVEDIKEELKDGNCVDDPLYFQGKIDKCDSENIVTEVKEEVIVNDSFRSHEINNPLEVEPNTVYDDLDIIEHKIETI